MAIKGLSPFIMLNGTAAAAIALYERVLGARVLSVVRASDVPAEAASGANPDRIVHAVLSLGGVLMLSDQSDEPPESNVQVALDFDDVDEMTQKFTALAQGGQVSLALQRTFWGATFGMLTDAFGVRWMFNCATPAEALV
jgi:PhnB protein